MSMMPTPDLIQPRSPAEAAAACLYQLWSTPAYWIGALRTRRYFDDHAGILRAEAILAALTAGTPLHHIPEFHSWLAEGTRFPPPPSS